MKITSATSISVGTPPGASGGVAPEVGNTKDFLGIKQSLQQEDAFAEISNVEKQIVSGKEFSPKELLGYQIKVARFGIRVELTSKVAEGVLGTVRRLENPQ